LVQDDLHRARNAAKYGVKVALGTAAEDVCRSPGEAMFFTKLVLAALMIGGVATAALANSSTVTLKDRENAACFNDVQRLCGNFIPDEDAVKSCMAAKRRQVSAACAKFYKPGAR
jgi:hypothetical protein